MEQILTDRGTDPSRNDAFTPDAFPACAGRSIAFPHFEHAEGKVNTFQTGH